MGIQASPLATVICAWMSLGQQGVLGGPVGKSGSGALSYLVPLRAEGVWTLAWPAQSWQDGLGSLQELSHHALLGGSLVVIEDWPGGGGLEPGGGGGAALWPTHLCRPLLTGSG